MAKANPLQRYQVMEPLGSGGQGSTYRGIDRETSKDVAIKIISLKQLAEWKSFDLFEREVEVLASLSHPGIPKYVDNYAAEESGDYFLVMELVEGAPLSKYVESDSKLVAHKVSRVFEQALDILEYLHGRSPPVIHRDLKPANMILRPDGRLVLVDFGGVRRQQGGTKSTVVGTFGYMAPEQLHGDADARSDIYALGATIATLLTGIDASDLPHDGLRLDLPALELTERWREVLEPMLEPEPKQRLASVAAVRQAYRSGAKRSGAKSPKKDSAQNSAPPPGSGSTSEPTVALAKIPAGAQALARAPAPFSVLVWILTALGGGALLVFEVVMLPLIYQIWSAILREPKDSESDRRMEADFEEFRARVKAGRQTLDYVAKNTRPG